MTMMTDILQTDLLLPTDAAVKKIAKILSKEDNAKFFRVAVNGGGCSGFQYDFTTDTTKKQGDYEIPCGDYVILLDDMSVPFVKGAVLDYVTQMIGSGFEIKNPNAKSSCGCGVSFSV